LNNNGYSSIGSLSNAVGSEGFGTYYRYRNEETQQLDGELLPVDYAANAASMGAYVIKATTVEELKNALRKAKTISYTTLIYIEVDRKKAIPGFAWWDVPVAEISESSAVKESLKNYHQNKKTQKYYL
jgi:3D-(3,5/4)-trihydroxycyclohexane-1,2-dione acylhydrolase (decyclizing)